MAIQTYLIDEVVWSDSTYADCAGGITMDWELAAGVGAEQQDTEAPDEISSNESNTWRIHQHFSDRPTNEVPDSCYDEPMARPGNFAVKLEFADGEYETDSSGYAPINDLYFRYPEPDDGDGASADDGYEFALDLAASTSSNVYAGLASVIVRYIISGSGANFSDTNNKVFDWDIPLSGWNHDDLPHQNGDKGETAEVRFNVDNETAPGDDHYVKYLPEYTFQYPATDSNYCGCTSWYWTTFRSVSPYLGFVGFTSV